MDYIKKAVKEQPRQAWVVLCTTFAVILFVIQLIATGHP